MKNKINRLSPLHSGRQPIRVLQFNIAAAFENSNPQFIELILKIMKDSNLQPGIKYVIEDEKVNGPFVDRNKRIHIQETFLSYLWCMSYVLVVTYDEALAKMSENRVLRYDKNTINTDLLAKAESLWQYGKSLIGSYSKWDMELPNPENYYHEDEWWIHRVNGIYVNAMKFILCHEFAHVEKQHFERFEAGENTDADRVLFENEADNRAIELVLQGSTIETSTTIRFGILIGLCSLLFFRKTTASKTYPRMDERIHNILDRVNPEPQDGMWGVATLAYRLWDGQFTKMFDWDNNLGSYKDLYYYIKKQVEEDSKSGK